MPGKALNEKQHPAKRVFQAIRIEVNQEFEKLKDLFPDNEKMWNKFPWLEQCANKFSISRYAFLLLLG